MNNDFKWRHFRGEIILWAVGCYGIAILELKNEGKMPQDTEHRQVKYLNNIVESDHGKIKRIIKPTLGFKSIKTAYATIKGFEVMRSLKKEQKQIT